VAVLQGIRWNNNKKYGWRGVLFPVALGLICFLFLPFTATAIEDDDLCASDSPGTAWSRDNPCPLQPPDTSSPRTMLEDFMFFTSKGLEALHDGKDKDIIRAWFERAERCLNLSQVSPDRKEAVAIESGLLLYGALNRIGLPEFLSIPDEQTVSEKEITKWVVPHTDITIAIVEEGEFTGEFLFTPRTVENAADYYAKVRHLPNRTNYTSGNYESYVTRPALGIPYEWTDKLPGWAIARVYKNPLWKWLAILLLITLGTLLAMLIHRIGRSIDSKAKQYGGQWGIGTLISAFSLVIIPQLIDYLFTFVVGVRFELNTILSKMLLIASLVASIYALFAIIELSLRAIISSKQLKDRSVNAHFLKVSGRMFGIVASIIIVIASAEYLGVRLTPLLAGIGIGGLAVALAARPTLENVIGGFTLFADKPVSVGDYCRFGDEEGTVEEIGLRSTRIRKLDDTLVSIPNADFSNIQLHNITRRRQRLYRTTIGLRYETTPDQLRFVIANLREMLTGHPKVVKEPLYVRFIGFGAYSLDLDLFARIRTRDWLEYKAIREDINLRIVDIVKQAGTGFAFPSQTSYFAPDAGLDTERGQEAEEKVEFWRARNKLPFPEFEQEEQERLEDILDYPAKGSPDHTPREVSSEESPDTEADTEPRKK
jgi:MscS family membrane protein